MADNTSEYRIVVKVDPTEAAKGLGKVKDELHDVQDLLVTIGEAVGLHALAHEALELVESYEKVQNRLRNLTDGEEELKATTAELFVVAEHTRASFEATANVYAKLARANEGVGFTQAQLLQVTKALNEETIIQGRTSEDLTGIVGQLSIALQTGTLNARALRIIFRDYPDLAQALEVQLGATSREFKKLGAEGKITGEAILKALLGASDVIEDKFGRTIVTVDSALTNLTTNLQEFLAEENEGLHVTSLFADTIQLAADHVNVLAGAIGALGILISTELVLKFSSFIPKLAIFGEGMGALVAPALAVGFAAGAAGVGLRHMAEDIQRANEDIGGLNQLTTFGQIGAEVQLLQQKVRTLNEVLAANPGDERAAKLLDQYKTQLAEVSDSYDKLSSAKKRANADDQLVTNETRNLDEQIRLLHLSNQEREVQAKLLEIQQKLQQSGITLNPEQKSGVEEKLRNIQALLDQDKVLKQLRGTTEDYNRLVAAANVLAHAQGAELKITAEELKRIVESGGLPGYLHGLEQENQLLGLNAVQQANLSALREAAAAKGARLNGEEAARVIALANQSREFAAQTGILNELRGPQEAYAQRVEAANKLLEHGKISIAEFNQALSGAVQGPPVPSELKVIENLQRERDLVAATSREREIANKIYETTQAAGGRISDEAVAKIRAEMEATGNLTDQIEAEAAARKTVFDIQQEILTNLQGPQARVASLQTQLNVLFQQGKISVEEYNRGLEQLNIMLLQTDTSFSGGLSRGFSKIKLDAADFAKTSESLITDAYRGMSDAAAQFAQTGKLDFSSLISSMLADLGRLAAQSLFSDLFGLFGGHGAGGGLDLGNGGGVGAGLAPRAEGGDIDPDKPYLVGEKGPEVVMPKRAGRVFSNSASKDMLSGGRPVVVPVPPPQVNVHVTNSIDSKDLVAAGLKTREGEQHIMNIISRNKQSIRRELA